MRYFDKNLKRERAIPRFRRGSSKGLVLANVAVSFAVVGMFIGYLVLNNHTATVGFEVRTLEKRISELRNEGDRLSLRVVAAQAMESVDRQVAGLGFVPIDDVTYISSAPAMVAVK